MGPPPLPPSFLLPPYSSQAASRTKRLTTEAILPSGTVGSEGERLASAITAKQNRVNVELAHIIDATHEESSWLTASVSCTVFILLSRQTDIRAQVAFVQGDAETHTSPYLGPVGSQPRVHRVKLCLVLAHLDGDLDDFILRRFCRLFCLLLYGECVHLCFLGCSELSRQFFDLLACLSM